MNYGIMLSCIKKSRNGSEFICLRYAHIRIRRLSKSRFAVLPICPQIAPQCRTGMTGNGVRIRVLRMGSSEIPSDQDLRGPQAFSGAQVPLDSFFQLAAPEDPMLQLFSAFCFVDTPMGCQLQPSLTGFPLIWTRL